MNEKKIWKALIIIVSLIISFGFAVPYLISATSNLAVILGIILGLATVYFVIKSIIKLVKK